MRKTHCPGPIRQVRVLREVSTRADERRPRIYEYLRLRHIQCLHHTFLAAIAHQGQPRRVLLTIPGVCPALRVLSPLAELLAPLNDLIEFAVLVDLFGQER